MKRMTNISETMSQMRIPRVQLHVKASTCCQACIALQSQVCVCHPDMSNEMRRAAEAVEAALICKTRDMAGDTVFAK